MIGPIADEALASQDVDTFWYARRYPDVALSGLTPEAHYHRIGRLLGRAPNARQDRSAAATLAEGALAGTSAESLASVAARFGAAARRGDVPVAAVLHPPADQDGPLIPRPRGLHLGRGQIPDLDPEVIEDPLDAIRLHSPEDLAPLLPVLHILRALSWRPHRGLRDLAPLVAGRVLRSGPEAIADLWSAGPSQMSMKIGGEAEGCTGGFVTAWQGAPDDPGRLWRIGQAALPFSGPLWWDLDLLNPFMPVLVCLSDELGFTRDTALLPFPSLARGASHAAEAALHAENGDGIRSFWRLTERLLTALEIRRPAIGRIEVMPMTATGLGTGSEPIFDPHLGAWLDYLFGLRPGIAAPLGGAALADEGQDWLASAHPPKDREGTRTLLLPADQIPTFAALLATEAELPDGTAAAPFLVADAATGDPRWSVTLPGGAMTWLAALQPLPRAAACPILRAGSDAAAEGPPVHSAEAIIPFPLGIARRNAVPLAQAQSLMRLAPDAPGPILPQATPPVGPFSIAITLDDADRALALLAAVMEASGTPELDILVLPQPGAATARFLANARAGYGMTPRILPTGTTLADVAELARHDEILTLDDHAVLIDGRTIAALRGMLAVDPSVGSAACTLLRQAFSGNKETLAASGGLFPTAISLLSAPALVIEEPDLASALPLATYPVLGVPLDLALLRRDAVVAAAPLIADAPAGEVDTAFALASAAAGYVHLMTSAVAVGSTALPRTRRSEMDPLGSAALRARSWNRPLSRVTLVRELR